MDNLTGNKQPLTANTNAQQVNEFGGGDFVVDDEVGQPDDAYETALIAMFLGFPVFPCNPLNKRPLIKDWRNKATLDSNLIADWWKQYPTAMVGALTGEPSGYFIIDIDVKDGVNAKTKLQALRAKFGDLSVESIVGTPSGGLHLYCKMPAGVDVRNSTSKLAPGIDVRGTGGYIIFPGSVRQDGKTYRFVKEA